MLTALAIAESKTFLVNLAALGTIGDLVALVGINRALVKYLLYSQKFSIGIKELMKVLNINNVKSIEEIAYYISPALNAAGRMGQADTAVELLLSDFISLIKS